MAAANEFKKAAKIAYSKVVERIGGPTINGANTLWIVVPRRRKVEVNSCVSEE